MESWVANPLSTTNLVIKAYTAVEHPVALRVKAVVLTV